MAIGLMPIKTKDGASMKASPTFACVRLRKECWGNGDAPCKAKSANGVYRWATYRILELVGPAARSVLCVSVVEIKARSQEGKVLYTARVRTTQRGNRDGSAERAVLRRIIGVDVKRPVRRNFVDDGDSMRVVDLNAANPASEVGCPEELNLFCITTSDDFADVPGVGGRTLPLNVESPSAVERRVLQVREVGRIGDRRARRRRTLGKEADAAGVARAVRERAYIRYSDEALPRDRNSPGNVITIAKSQLHRLVRRRIDQDIHIPGVGDVQVTRGVSRQAFRGKTGDLPDHLSVGLEEDVDDILPSVRDEDKWFAYGVGIHEARC